MKSTLIILSLLTIIVSNQENQNLRTLQPGQNSGSSTNSYDYTSIEATQKVTSTETISSDLEASAADTSVVYVSGSGVATIDSVKLSKKGGDSSNTENSEFYGVNAALLVNGANAILTGLLSQLQLQVLMQFLLLIVVQLLLQEEQSHLLVHHLQED